MISTITFTPSGGSAITIHSVAIGSTAVVTRAEGLQGSPMIREVKTFKGQQSGAYIRSKYLDARSITLEGEIIGSSIEASFDRYDAIANGFMQSINTPGSLKWTRDSSGQALQIDCQLQALSPLVLSNGGNMLQYQVTLVAANPRVLDQSETTANSDIITNAASGATAYFSNAGSMPTAPKIRVYGALDAPWVRLTTGAGLLFTGTVADGNYLEIDVLNRTVKTNGSTNALSTLNAAQSDWFELPAGSSTVKLSGSGSVSANTKLQLIYRSAWA
ncbi:MAG: phage distal tail protein [Chthoniobacterales bacterium]